MKLHKTNILFIAICLWLLFSPFAGQLWGKEFVVVIDAGHGGHDPGAVGKISKEKNINLNVALKVGNLIKNQCSDVKVVYTRNKDVFIPLDRRAEIANNAKADLFISIHTNALARNRTIQGASTWTLGLAKSDDNLEVAKRENAVILYEDDYSTRYAGFNPNSAESYIIFEFMQDKYMEQSVQLASLVQKQFRHTCQRTDRGVHQAGFLVLKASAMPSVLIELGFISTPNEEQYLNSQQGINTMANGIYRAFLSYKREYELRLTGSSQTDIPSQANEPDAASTSAAIRIENEAEKEDDQQAATPVSDTTAEQTNNTDITFKVQILASPYLLTSKGNHFKGLRGVKHYKEGKTYKYTYGSSTDYNEMLRTRREVAAKFKGAFIIAFRNEEKIEINAAIAEFKRKRNK